MAERNNLNITVSGIYPLGHFSFNYPDPLAVKTLFTQLMLEKGFLATNAFYASYAHKEQDIDKYLNAVDEAFSFIANTFGNGGIDQYLKGARAHSGFTRLI